jgi:uncharacterized protein (DUF302 family)
LEIIQLYECSANTNINANRIGTMLPCNVIVQELPSGEVEVAAVDPVASMKAIDNPELGQIATEIRKKLKHVVEGLK